jgi:glycosyltransferase involved in cell wall biosynthesis
MSIEGSGHNLTIVQYAGDFREASVRFAQGGDENYRAQRYTVNYVEGLAKRFSQVTTITWMTNEQYDTVLPSGARAIGAGGGEAIAYDKLIMLLESTRPNLLILRSPFRQLLHWSYRRKIRTMALLADSFVPNSMKQHLSFYVLKTYLNRGNVDIVANHGMKASATLSSIGVDPRKILPWDYPAFDSPCGREPKPCSSPDNRICYVGNLSEAKGVFDLIDAIGNIRKTGRNASADIIGTGAVDRVLKLISNLGLDGIVNLVGQVPNPDIISRMRQSDVVVVPSRHSYAEGMPLTIYEALCSRTPLVVSDHPMFLGNVRHEESALVFPSGNASAMAQQITRLLDDKELYARLSNQSIAAWERLQIAVTWDALIDGWSSGRAGAKSLLEKYSLAKVTANEQPSFPDAEPSERHPATAPAA